MAVSEFSPGANINYQSGHAIFEATHGTAPDIAGKGYANPCSLLFISNDAVGSFRLVRKQPEITTAIEAAIERKIVTRILLKL